MLADVSALVPGGYTSSLSQGDAWLDELDGPRGNRMYSKAQGKAVVGRRG